MLNKFKKIGVHLPTIMLPAKSVDLYKWAVVACDQYTSQPEYWEEVAALVGDAPSTLHMIFPEVYLGKDAEKERIENIIKSMKKYINEGILESQKPGFIYLDRKTSHTSSRTGLMIALDLEHYDYNRGSQTLIRATEGTVLERIPPRVRIRENAIMELPHIMVLIDDPGKTVIEPLENKLEQFKMVYDTDLMMDGGHVTGYKIDNESVINEIVNALEKLSDEGLFMAKYNVGTDKKPLLFAVGDGNHSLATAKACWEKLKILFQKNN